MEKKRNGEIGEMMNLKFFSNLPHSSSALFCKVASFFIFFRFKVMDVGCGDENDDYDDDGFIGKDDDESGDVMMPTIMVMMMIMMRMVSVLHMAARRICISCKSEETSRPFL